MAYILHLETTTQQCSVALSFKGKCIAEKELLTEHFSHGEKLHVFIQEVLHHANVEFSPLDAIAISKGPGSYTGLRIGVSAAKGLCFALNIPLISVPTLEALAHQVENPKGILTSSFFERVFFDRFSLGFFGDFLAPFAIGL